jgi:hypothetical protein
MPAGLSVFLLFLLLLAAALCGPLLSALQL